MTLSNYSWEFKKIMLDQFKAQMRPSLCFRFELGLPSVVTGFEMTPLNYKWGFKKSMLDQFKAQMRPTLCF